MKANNPENEKVTQNWTIMKASRHRGACKRVLKGRQNLLGWICQMMKGWRILARRMTKECEVFLKNDRPTGFFFLLKIPLSYYPF